MKKLLIEYKGPHPNTKKKWRRSALPLIPSSQLQFNEGFPKDI